MKRITIFALIGAFLEFVCKIFYFLINVLTLQDIPIFLQITIQALQVIGAGLICYFFYAIWKGQSK